jgi:nucleoside-diphosphate-sugar epimerase
MEYGVETVIVRPGHIYGPQCIASDNRAASEFARSAAAHRDIIMKSKGTQLRSYCYSLDCASAILTVLIVGVAGNAYNISNKNSVVTISDLAKECARAGQVELIYEEPSEHEKKSFNLMPTSALNAKKLEELGWKALFDLREGIERTVYLLFSGCAS